MLEIKRHARKSSCHGCLVRIVKSIPQDHYLESLGRASWCQSQTVTLGQIFLSAPHTHERLLYFAWRWADCLLPDLLSLHLHARLGWKGMKISFRVVKQFFRVVKQFHIIEPRHHKTNKMTSVPSEDSNQPGYPPSLIRVCCPHEETLGPYTYNYPLGA